MSRLAQVKRDLVTIGPMAPVRAVYEVAKRSGAHGVGLRGFVGTARLRPLVALECFALPSKMPPEARDRTIEEAHKIVGQGLRVFGTRVPLTRAKDWISLPGTALAWPDSEYWWDIDIRTDARIGDVKWTWEMGRHRDLVVLARAAALEPDGPWLSTLDTYLTWWFEITPSEVGVHWYSNLELALRVVAWMQIVALVGDRLEQGLMDRMADHVARMERHLLFDFPYTASSMRNNHLLGDALGLVAIDRFRGGDGSSRTARTAERFFRNQLSRHMHPDGSMIEDSLSYHRFVMEMLSVKIMLGECSDVVTASLRGAADHLVRLGAFEGPLPQWGDWDEGRVLASSGDALDVAGSVALALALTSGGVEPSWAGEHDEVAWYSPTALSSDHSLTTGARNGCSGDHTRMQSGDWLAWLKSSLGESHQHADLGHLSVRRGASWLTVDPGTGTYNGDLDIRNGFRTGSAHNGLQADGAQVLEPHRAFRWLGNPETARSEPVRLGGFQIALVGHNAFMDAHRSRVVRVVVLCDSGFVCVDWAESPFPASLSVALAPESIVEDQTLKIASGLVTKMQGLESASQVTASRASFAGWNSTTYGDWVPAPWLQRHDPAARSVAWSISDTGFMLSQDNEKVVVKAEDGDTVSLDVAFEASGPRLRMHHRSVEHAITLEVRR